MTHTHTRYCLALLEVKDNIFHILTLISQPLYGHLDLLTLFSTGVLLGIIPHHLCQSLTSSLNARDAAPEARGVAFVHRLEELLAVLPNVLLWGLETWHV